MPSLNQTLQVAASDGSTHKKCLIFAHHKDMIAGIIKTLTDDLKLVPNQDFIVITGSTEPKARQPLVSQFQDDPKCKIAVLSLKAAGVGLNFFKASLVLMMEMYFVPGALLQAEARAHRQGQVRDVLVMYLLA
jgi:SWI/SNF-related matrix-associated actin-dependent regulator 1 of chromatin subfamily A